MWYLWLKLCMIVIKGFYHKISYVLNACFQDFARKLRQLKGLLQNYFEIWLQVADSLIMKAIELIYKEN